MSFALTVMPKYADIVVTQKHTSSIVVFRFANTFIKMFCVSSIFNTTLIAPRYRHIAFAFLCIGTICLWKKTYKINGEQAIHLNSRPQAKDARPSTKSKNAGSCVTCKRYIQDRPNRFCSISCKISASPEKHKFCFSPEINQSALKKEHYNQEQNLEEKKSCTSSLTDVSEDSDVLLGNFSLRPLVRILKRKGVSRRSPLN
ncbi:hypothetical protein HID58_048928 [Brassica napus]|uniref:PLATZ transcription factor family protein n=1 Tax=Brassica napus TaxID=3708 RepID=A0ABQ8B3I6_BRANA|nr:hypothetical protein HID58_048928 [Brassica napus]